MHDTAPSAERLGWRRTFVRTGMIAVYRLRRLKSRMIGARTFGVRALPVTPDGRVVLVRHSYAPGWYLPGGGRARSETAEQAALRELREEIGMTGHGAVHPIQEYSARTGRVHDSIRLFLVEQVGYRPVLSLEIEAIAAFAPDALPEAISPSSRRQIEAWWTARSGADGGT